MHRSGLVMDTRCPLQVQDVHNRIQSVHGAPPRCVWAPPDTSWMGKGAVRGKKEASSTFVLPAVATMSTYNVGSFQGVCMYYVHIV